MGGAVDWDATLAYRRHLWSWGLGVAEAMDTAQRGMGLGWHEARELIRRSAAEARACDGRLAAGAGTDQLPAGRNASLSQIRDAYLEQCAFVEEHGCRVILMASRALAAAARGPDDYRAVLDPVLEATAGPVILHWLGDMFDPALAGYWGWSHLDGATDEVLGLISDHADKVDGISSPCSTRSVRSGCGSPARRRSPLQRRRLQLPGTDRGRQPRAARHI